MARTAAKHQPSARTPQWELTDWQCLGMLALLVGIYFARILLGSAFLWEDFTYQWYPFRHFAAVSLAHGEIPLWNPYTFNGMPFLAEIQTEVFYLPMTLLTLAVHNGGLGVLWLEWVNVLHYLLAAAGMFFLARSFGLQRIPALFSAITYAFSGFLVVHAIHQVIIAVAAWFPLILLLFRKALKGERWTWVFLCGIVLGHSFFGGSPQMSLFFYLFLLCYFLFELFSTFGLRRLPSRPALLMTARAAAVVALSLGIAMVQFLPTRELSELSVRAQITFEKATEGSLGWGQLVTLLVPKFFGVSDAHGYSYWGPGPYWHYWETCVYVGVPALLLALLAVRFLRENREAAFFAGCVVFALLFSLGGNFIVYPLFFHSVPGFSAFRNPARMGVFVALGGALLAGMALQHILAGSPPGRTADRVRKALLVICGTALVFLLLALGGFLDGAFSFLGRQQIRTLVRKELIYALILTVSTAGILYAMVLKRSAAHLLGLLLCVLGFIDLYVFGAGHNTSPDDPAGHFRRADPLITFLRQQEGIFRVNTRNAEGIIMDRNQGMLDRIFTMEGYTPLVLQRVYPPVPTVAQSFDLQNIRYFTVTDTLHRTLTLQERPRTLPRAHMVYSTRSAHSEEDVRTIMMDPGFDPWSTAVVEGDAGAPLVAPPVQPLWQASISAYANNSISARIDTDHDGFLVLSEAYYPGWEVTIDGQPAHIFRANYAQRGVPMPRGTHAVEFRFAPRSYQHGLWMTIVTLCMCSIGIVVSLQRSRAGTPPTGHVTGSE